MVSTRWVTNRRDEGGASALLSHLCKATSFTAGGQIPFCRESRREQSRVLAARNSRHVSAPLLETIPFLRFSRCPAMQHLREVARLSSPSDSSTTVPFFDLLLRGSFLLVGDRPVAD